MASKTCIRSSAASELRWRALPPTVNWQSFIFVPVICSSASRWTDSGLLTPHNVCPQDSGYGVKRANGRVPNEQSEKAVRRQQGELPRFCLAPPIEGGETWGLLARKSCSHLDIAQHPLTPSRFPWRGPPHPWRDPVLCRGEQAREPWRKEEHERFLEALDRYGRNWKQIVDHVGTRSVQQASVSAASLLHSLHQHCEWPALQCRHSTALLARADPEPRAEVFPQAGEGGAAGRHPPAAPQEAPGAAVPAQAAGFQRRQEQAHAVSGCGGHFGAEAHLVWRLVGCRRGSAAVMLWAGLHAVVRSTPCSSSPTLPCETAGTPSDASSRDRVAPWSCVDTFSNHLVTALVLVSVHQATTATSFGMSRCLRHAKQAHEAGRRGARGGSGSADGRRTGGGGAGRCFAHDDTGSTEGETSCLGSGLG